jgi:hypothetical protein
MTVNEERVAIYVDYSNLLFSVKDAANIPNIRISMGALAENLSAGRRMVSRNAFASFDIVCVGMLQRSCDIRADGFDLVTKKLGFGGEKEVDTAMVAKIVSDACDNVFDTAIIVSGDRDFVPAVEFAKARGKRVEVAAFSENISADLINKADLFIKLNDIPFIDASRCFVKAVPLSAKDEYGFHPELRTKVVMEDDTPCTPANKYVAGMLPEAFA